ncbi:MAG: hypothetical protein L6R38_009252 [Xanthoria sp. 2 TBL-2021]|nr:MAG: hypothetical protein L6R38_009252 [Xanthoria sp. 2 TBL-2021]
MSLDLLQEFGCSSHDDEINPWASSSSHNVTNNGSTEEDDFGDFAHPETSFELERDLGDDGTLGKYSKPSSQNQSGLLIDTETTKPPPSPSPSFRELNAPLKLAIPQEKSDGNVVDIRSEDPTPITAWPSYARNRAKSFGKPLPLSPYTEDHDDWGDFQEEPQTETIVEDPPSEINPMVHIATNKKFKQDTSLLDLMDSLEVTTTPPARAPAAAEEATVTAPELSSISTAGPAPSNVPPPSVLLSIIVTILDGLPDEIRDIVSSMSTSLMNDAFPSNESLFENLHDKLATTTASARILAGRKLRWKRDTHLAQRMSIGPANAGKAGGMKLTGVDRTEARREDQEAAEVVRMWKQQAGGIKSQIAKINAQQSEVKFALLEYSDNMPIRVAKLGEGGLAAPKCCFLCGLKRDERVARLDVNVEDSFGEWWVDHWGHVDCIRFWEEHKDSLMHR